VTDINEAVTVTFSHIAILLDEISSSLSEGLEALFAGNVYTLKHETERAKQIRQWSNIIIANTFKSLRLLQKKGDVKEVNYLQVVRRLQKISNGYAEITTAAFEHVANNHKLLLPEQVQDLEELKKSFVDLMQLVQTQIKSGPDADLTLIRQKKDELKKQVESMRYRQLERIQDGDSKTRLSILYFTIVGNLYMIVSQVNQLLAILEDTFNGIETRVGDLE